MTFSHYEQYLALLQYYTSEDGKMAYLDLGEGPCLLLLHGCQLRAGLTIFKR